MKYMMLFFMVLCLVLNACRNNSSYSKLPINHATDSTRVKDSVIAQQSFFPVPDYIGGELKIIDSLQLPITIAVTTNNKAVSRIATDKELRTWAANFQEPDISSPALKKSYTETSIADQGDPSVTLIYTATDSKLPIQKINVYIKPSPSENDKVTGIFIEKQFAIQDTIVNQKLYWKTGKNLQVITEKKIKALTLPAEQVKITWNPS